MVHIRSKYREIRIQFVWIGSTHEHASSQEAMIYLKEQVRRSQFTEGFTLLPPVRNLELFYSKTDVLFLSSRLDPFPNVSIDAMHRGLPVVCFANASGVAEMLQSTPETADLVVPYMDVAAAGEAIGRLARDRSWYGRASAALKKLAATRFDMDSYVETLHAAGTAAADRVGRLRSRPATVSQ
jgi:glycosyltransferase involved in cell wall biosynthesis